MRCFRATMRCPLALSLVSAAILALGCGSAADPAARVEVETNLGITSVGSDGGGSPASDAGSTSVDSGVVTPGADAATDTCHAFTLEGAKTSWFAAAVLGSCPRVPIDTNDPPGVQCAFQTRLLHDVPNLLASVLTRSTETQLTILYQTYNFSSNYSTGTNSSLGTKEANYAAGAPITGTFDAFVTPDNVLQTDIDAVVDAWNNNAVTLDPHAFVTPHKMATCGGNKAANGHDPCDTCSTWPRW